MGSVRPYVRRTGVRAKTLMLLEDPSGKQRLVEAQYEYDAEGKVRRQMHTTVASARPGREVFPPLPYQRPLTRAECEDGDRPCPYVSCKHHLYLDVNPETGSIKLNFPDREPWELTESCSLDVAERGGITLEEVGAIVNLTRERVRQVEARAAMKLRLLRELPEPKED